MLSGCTAENKERLGNEVLKMCRSLYNTKQMLPAAVSGLSGGGGRGIILFHIQTLYYKQLSVTVLEEHFAQVIGR